MAVVAVAAVAVAVMVIAVVISFASQNVEGWLKKQTFWM